MAAAWDSRGRCVNSSGEAQRLVSGTRRNTEEHLTIERGLAQRKIWIWRAHVKVGEQAKTASTSPRERRAHEYIPVFEAEQQNPIYFRGLVQHLSCILSTPTENTLTYLRQMLSPEGGERRGHDTTITHCSRIIDSVD
ncbi:hypothetical protein SCP_0409250 [Sparassis crispa]|uniref:Uncharacterized protein n=1 Tax=Sparassis crispa TaxID=139825 RepID=A0A401GK44_9APHY|nr:hypothetical protein SCP_0409250 [Sparassis crispa]GBE82541.1 hypothetical protein SCP_0409250 [Sparassis crispa]